MAKGVRWEIENWSLRAITGLVEENASLAAKTRCKIRWFIEGGTPVGEISQYRQVLWRESYCASHFHLAYACMIRGMNKKLTQIFKKQEEILKQYDEQNKR